jgi:pentatricopeptide repeat protein
MDDIPERLEFRCMVPVTFQCWNGNTAECVVHYNGTGLDLFGTIFPAGLKSIASDSEIDKWFRDDTEDHYVEFIGGLHGRGNFYGHDRKTKEVRSLYHDMKELGFAVEDDE